MKPGSPFVSSFQRIVIVLFLLAVTVAGLHSSYTEQKMPKEILYIGTFGDYIHVFEFDRTQKKLIRIQTVSGRKGPGFQAIHPEGSYLYSVSGERFSEEDDGGTITTYRIDRSTGNLEIINEQSTAGGGPCHVSVDPKGEYVFVSNYSGGNLSMYRIRGDGGLEPAAEVIQHEGGSIHERRQQGPHVHSAIPSADGKFLYVSDLGIDKIMIYAIDRINNRLLSAESPFIEHVPGSGPRHFVIHPNGAFAYSAEELSSTVAVFTVDQPTGALTQIQRIEMLPTSFEGSNTAADIHISPDGKFLYASNRGHESLAIYSIDRSTGQLSLIGHKSTRGAHPRNFAVDIKGEFVFVANRDNNNVVVFERDKATGMLTYTGNEAEVPVAVCVTQFIPD